MLIRCIGKEYTYNIYLTFLLFIYIRIYYNFTKRKNKHLPPRKVKMLIQKLYFKAKHKHMQHFQKAEMLVNVEMLNLHTKKHRIKVFLFADNIY